MFNKIRSMNWARGREFRLTGVAGRVVKEILA